MPKTTERSAVATPQINNSRKKAPAQADLILRYMRENGSITQMDAYEHLYGVKCTRLSGRIKDLRSAGYNIVPVMEDHPKTGTRYGRYYLQEEL